jgi:hypothetical protein
VGTGAGTIALEQSDPDRIEERIRALRRRVYGRDPSPEDVAALSAALGQLRPDPAEPVSVRAGSAEPARGEPSAERAPLPSRGVLATWWALLVAVPPRVLLTGVAVTVVAALAGAGALLLLERPASADADPVAARFVPAISVGADPAVLLRPRGPADRTTSLAGPDLVVASFRRLAAYPAAGVTIWAARDRFGETCLVVADTYYRTACADATTAKASGLVLVWSAGPGYPPSTTLSYTAVWHDGRLRAGPSTP